MENQHKFIKGEFMDYYVISDAELLHLVNIKEKLSALISVGVDNWSGWDDHIELLDIKDYDYLKTNFTPLHPDTTNKPKLGE